MKHISSAKKRAFRGFSLVETVLAVAIAATTVVTSISLMPSGMEQIRKSSNQAATARILRWVAQDLQARDFDEWANSAKAFQYQFDASGDPVNKANSGVLGSTFTVKVQPQVNGSSSGVSLPGADSTNSYLRQATVSITDTPGADPLKNVGPKTPNIWTRTVTVVCTEKFMATTGSQASL